MITKELIKRLSSMSKTDTKQLQDILSLFFTLLIDLEPEAEIILQGWNIIKIDKNTIYIQNSTDDETVTKVLLTELKITQ